MAEKTETSLRSGSDVIFDFFCELCKEDNLNVEAQGYCEDCQEYLCGSCYSGHRKTRTSRHHVLLDKGNMPKDRPLSTERVSKDIATKCKNHSAKFLEYYCKTHGVLGCSTCIVTGHRGCSDIEAIVDASDNILESQTLKDFISLLQSIKMTSRDIVTRARENRAVSERCYTEVVSAVRGLKEEVIKILNEIEQNILTHVEKLKIENEEKTDSVVASCEVISENIEQVSSELESLQSSKRVCQLYIRIRESECEVKTLQGNLAKIKEDSVVRKFTFEPNADIMSLLKSPDVLGKVSQLREQILENRPKTISVETSGSVTSLHMADVSGKVSQQREQFPETSPRTATVRTSSNMTFSHVADIAVTSNSDTAWRCCITGSAVVSAQRLIVVDHNSKVKLVDTYTQRLLKEIKLSSQPWDVTLLNRNQAAVTLPDSKKILLLAVGDTLTSQREITVRGECRGVAYSQDRLFVTFVDDPRLEIIDLRGNLIRRIENNSDGSKLFGYPHYACVSQNGETVYVSDYSRGTVTSLTLDGVVKSVYKDEELRSPGNVCTDHHGNVYVCGLGNRNVHMITADCKKVKVILTGADGLDDGVWSVSHCQDTNRLFIGMNSNRVKVYQLS